jgi:branched-chain amino acid transport system substrate-binding protein
MPSTNALCRPVARPVLIALALLIAGVGISTLAGAQAVKEIVVGEVLPLSGAAATQGVQLRTGAEIAVDEINASGGIKALGGARIKLVLGDSKSTPDGGMAETERLITAEKTAILLGAFQSGVTFPATEVAERYKTPWIVNVAVKDEITERGFKYVFRDFNKASYDVKEIIAGNEVFAKETGKKPATVALLYEGTDWGRSTAAFVKKYFPEAGYKIVLDESYPPNQADFTPQLLKIKAAKPDYLVGCLYTPDHIIFSKQLMEQKLDLPFGFMSVGAGSEDPAYYKAVPPASVAYMFVQEDWDILAPKRPWYPAINDKAKAKLGYDANAYVAAGYGTMYLVKDVLERAKYDADVAKYRTAIRDAIVATDIAPDKCQRIERTAGGQKYCPALVRGITRIKFDEQGQNTFSHGLISQNLNGRRTILAPLDFREPNAKPAWPVPRWADRK